MMKDGPLFSFVMPAYKAEFIQESIQSILRQTYANLELIVVDDCSPEPIKDVVDICDDSRLTYFCNEDNIGGKDLVRQWNKCLSYATGEWVILATDDDVYEPTFLEIFLEMLKEHPDVDLFRGRICWIDEKNDMLLVERCYERYLSQLHFFYEMMDGMKGGIPQYIFRREKLIEKGGFVSFPMAWGSDDATAIMMSENGLLISEKPLVSFRWSINNISAANKYGKEKVQARILFTKWMLTHKPISIENEIDKLGFFYRDQIDKRLLTMMKVHLLVQMNAVSYFQRVVYMFAWMRQLAIFGCRDKLSILVRTLITNK